MTEDNSAHIMSLKYFKTENQTHILIANSDNPFEVFVFGVHSEGVVLLARKDTGYSRQS